MSTDLGSPLGFLSKLRPISQLAEAEHTNRFYFRLDTQSRDGQVFIDTVDTKGNHVDVNPNAFDEPNHTLLKLLGKGQVPELSYNWGQPGGTYPVQGVPVDSNPAILYQLFLCDNIVDGQMKKITADPDISQIRLSLTESSPDAAGGSIIIPAVQLIGGNVVTDNFKLISDSFAYADNVLYKVKSLGENFSQLNIFVQPFAADVLEAYLSVLYTYLPDIGISYKDYCVERSKETLSIEPTLVIERISSDKSLYLRLSQGRPGKLSHLVGNLGVTVSSSLTADKKIRLRPIRQFDMEARSEALYEEIKRYSPTRAEAKQVYHDENGFYIIPESTAAPFLMKGLPALLSRYNVVGTDKLREYKLTPLRPKINLNISSGIDFLEGEATVDLGNGTDMTLGELLKQYSKNNYINLSDGERGIIDPNYVRRIERIFKTSDKGGGKVTVSFFDLPEVTELLGERITDSPALERPRAFYSGFNAISVQRLSLPDINATLRPYQKYGVKWLMYLYRNHLGGCLADDMGLGKTLQTIAFISKVHQLSPQPILIVMPRSLLFNWQSEFSRFAPGIATHIYYGATRDIAEAMKSQVILTTYALVRNDIELLMKEKFHITILDESQSIKNVSTGVSKSVLLLDSAHRFALSGTPIENNLTELYSLFRFLNPAMFGSLDDFTCRYAAPIQQNDDTEALADLRRRIFPFMLRRVKSEVLSELPDRQDQTLPVDMDTEQARLYEQRRVFFQERVRNAIASEGLAKSSFVMFQALNELRRIASVPESLTDGKVSSAKLDLLTGHLLDAVANGHKAVVFFNFIAGIEIIGERLEREGIDYACMTGSTTDRRSVVQRFQTDPTCRVLLMTLKTGGVGLNLTAADTVFIVEPWWNKAAEEQAINRLHRFGQTAKVMCYSLITKGTIEEKIRELQQQKADLFAEVITADATRPKHLTEEDINFMLS